MDLPLIESRRIAAGGYSILESGFSDDIPYSEDYYEVRYHLLLITVLHMKRLFVVSPFPIPSHMIVVFPKQVDSDEIFDTPVDWGIPDTSSRIHPIYFAKSFSKVITALVC